MFVYWILFPLLLGAALTGLGLGVRKLSMPFSAALILPVGYAAAVVISCLLTWSGSITLATGPIVVVLALAGWAVSIGDIRASWADGSLKRQWPWVAAAVLGFLFFGAPVIASGTPTYTGYNQIVDLSPQMNFAAYLGVHGRDSVVGASSSLNMIASTLSTGYPAGPQSVLGTFPKTFGMAIEWSYQPYLAMAAALIISASYALLRQVTDSRTYAAIGAFVVGQASSLIGYGWIGGIKELTEVPMILTAAAFIGYTASADTKWWRAALPFTIALAGAYSVFSLTVLPWLGILGLGAALMVWQNTTLREAAIRVGAAVVFFAIVTLPTSFPARDSLSFADLMKHEQGNLANAVSKWAMTGVWITPDHRFTLTGSAKTISVIIGVLVIAFAILGLWTAWNRKAKPLVILFVASMVGMVILLVRMGPWVDFKGMVVASPAWLLLALVGLSTFFTLPRKQLSYVAWALLAGLTFTQVYSDALRYGSAQLGPYDRLRELEHLGKKYAGAKGTLIPDWDENAAYEMRQAGAVQAFNYPFVASAEYAKDPAKPDPMQQYSWDLDQMDPTFVRSFELIVMRHSPGQSRPPRDYVMVDQGKYFDVWRRNSDAPADTHQAYTGAYTAVEQQQCQKYLATLPRTQTVTISATVPTFASVTFDPSKTTGDGLTLQAGNTAVMANGKSGTANGTVDVGAAGGEFDVYANNLSRRDISLNVAGQKLRVERDPSAAPRPQFIKTISVAAGSHPVSLTEGGTTLYPGTSHAANIGSWAGSVTLVPHNTLYPALIKGTAGTVQCPGAVDWVETP